MQRLRYIFGGEDLPIAPSPLNVEEEGDSWWSGVYFNAVAIPIASTLATIALSASLCLGYQQQTEDIVPQPPSVVSEEDQWFPLLANAQCPILRSPWADDDFVQPPAAQIYEEESWQVYTPKYEPVIFLYLPDLDELPAGSLYGVPDEEPWTPPTIPVHNVLAYPIWVGDDFPQQAVVFGLDEGEWLPQPILAGHGQFKLFWADEEIVPQPVLPPDEDFWQVYTPPYPPLSFLYLPDPEEIPAGSLVSVLQMSPLKYLSLELGGGLSQTLLPVGNVLTISMTNIAPILPPSGGRGVVFQVSGGVVTVWVWDGVAWRS